MTEPTPDPTPQQVLRAAENLEGAMAGLRSDMRSLATYSKRSRHLIWGLAVSLTLDVVVSIVLAVVAVQAHHASERATDATSTANLNRQAQVTTCKSSNASRATAQQLWVWIIDESEKNPALTAQQRYEAEVLRAKVIAAYKQRNCSPGALEHSKAP